jgi:transposase
MSKQRRTFTEEFKQEAVKLTRQPGAGKAAIARDLGIGVNLLARWVKAEEEVFSPMRSNKGEGASSQEYDRMRRELAKVKMERDILKKALGFFAADLK